MYIYRASWTWLPILTYRKKDDSGKRSLGHGTGLKHGVNWRHKPVAKLVARGYVVAPNGGQTGGQTRERQVSAPATLMVVAHCLLLGWVMTLLGGRPSWVMILLGGRPSWVSGHPGSWLLD